MSAPTNTAAQSDTKRGRSSETVDSESSAQPVSSDRSVRQRIEPSAVLSVPAPSAAAASAAVSSAAVTPATLSFMRLAVVERQLMMQGLDLKSLARLASTCKQMRGEALHREAGKFVPVSDPSGSLLRQRWVHENHPAHASPLFRMHMPVRLSFFTAAGALTSAEREALTIKAANFSRITELSDLNDRWTEAQMLQLLAQPWLHSAHTVVMDSSVWLRSSAVQHALFALPQLTFVWLDQESVGGGWALSDSALSLASKLSKAQISLPAGDAKMIRALRSAPSLRIVELLSTDDAPLGPFIWSLPPALTELRLSEFSLDPDSTSRSALKTMFTRLPRLRRLCTTRMEIASLLQGVLDAGVNALPDLRRVEFAVGLIAGLDDDLLRRFLHKFATATVRFDYQNAEHDHEDEAANTAARRYGAWPRVEVVPLLTLPPPTVHLSDDEPESEVELEAEPAEEA